MQGNTRREIGAEFPDVTTISGKIGAMKDGYVSSFEYGNLTVEQFSESSIGVTDSEGNLIGGLLLLKTATVAEVQEWVENKVEEYGVTQ